MKAVDFAGGRTRRIVTDDAQHDGMQQATKSGLSRAFLLPFLTSLFTLMNFIQR